MHPTSNSLHSHHSRTIWHSWKRAVSLSAVTSCFSLANWSNCRLPSFGGRGLGEPARQTHWCHALSMVALYFSVTDELLQCDVKPLLGSYFTVAHFSSLQGRLQCLFTNMPQMAADHCLRSFGEPTCTCFLNAHLHRKSMYLRGWKLSNRSFGCLFFTLPRTRYLNAPIFCLQL